MKDVCPLLGRVCSCMQQSYVPDSTTLLYYTSQYSTVHRSTPVLYSTTQYATAHGLSCGCLLPLFTCAGEQSVLSHSGHVRVCLENIYRMVQQPSQEHCKNLWQLTQFNKTV